MNRKKLFIENILSYGFVNILVKIVPFLLLPIITRMIPETSDFGIYSMFTTIIGFGTPFVILGIYDALFREYFEQEDVQYRYNVTTTAQRIILVSSTIVSIMMIILNKSFSILFFGSSEYKYIVILAAIGVFLGGNLSPIQAPTRLQNHRKIFVLSGFISSSLTYVLALLLIMSGLSYFGLIYSSVITSLILLMFFWIRNRHYFIKGNFDWKIAKELFKIGLPLLPTFLIYWIYNSMDKIMIANLLGTTQLGIYSIGSKMGQISQLIYAGFAGGWQYFAFSTMKDEDQVSLNSKVFEYLTLATLLFFVLIYPFIPIAFKLVFNGDYILGYQVAPYLFLAPLLLMLFQVAGNQFLVVKKSYLSTLTLILGALINLLLNILLISKMGIEGAAIATLTSYFVTILVVVIISKKMKLMYFSKRVAYTLVVIPVYLLLQRIAFYENFYFQLLLMIFVLISTLYLYKNDFKRLLLKSKTNS